MAAEIAFELEPHVELGTPKRLSLSYSYTTLSPLFVLESPRTDSTIYNIQLALTSRRRCKYWFRISSGYLYSQIESLTDAAFCVSEALHLATEHDRVLSNNEQQAMSNSFV